MEPQAIEPGSIQAVTERLNSWCIQNERGLARVEWDSAYARQEVVDRLKISLGNLGIELEEISLPPGQAAHETVARLIEKLRLRSGRVASITDIEWAFPEGGSRLDTLVALSFQRETLAELAVRQIWWVPSSLTDLFVLGVPDLDSWFFLKLHLTEAPPQPAGTVQEGSRPERKTVSVAEARSVARRFWERLEAARAQKLSEERIWAELTQPAIDALMAAGLAFEAERILARMADARVSLERELETLRQARSPQDPKVLALTSLLGRLLAKQGDFAGARQLQELVLESRMRGLGEEHADTLKSMNDLALTLTAEGDHAGARRLGEQVVKLRSRVLGEEHRDTLRSMNNLAMILREQGDLAGARRLQERVLETTSRTLGQDHPDTLAGMANLASILWAQGDLSGTRRLQERALERITRVLGEEHPDTLTAMSNLAMIVGAQGDLAEARRLGERALEVETRVLGEEHPDTLASMYSLAGTLRQAGDLDGAVRLLRKCLAGRRKVLGESHPKTAATAEFLTRLEAQAQQA